MKMFRLPLLIVAVVALALGGAAAQEKTGADKGWDTTATKQIEVETGLLGPAVGRPGGPRQPTFDLAELYRENAKDPEALRGLVARALHTYLAQKSAAAVRGGGGSPAQAAADAQLQLAAVQVYQNERIIALLEALAKK